MSLSAGTLQFYPLHITLLKFSEECPGELIGGGRAVVAYLSVTFEAGGKLSHQKSFEATKSRSFLKVDKLCALHESIEGCLNPIQMVAEVKLDLLGLKRGFKKITLYHKCFGKWEDFSYITSAERQSLRHTKDLLNSMKKLGISEQLKTVSGRYLSIPFWLF